MSAAANAAALRDSGKKAVHVKWAGKTIALGTFPAAEADEKCARAKALTRAWRSTMRPKPSREWVMLELERLGVRVVSGRLGRKAGEDDEGGPEPKKGVPMPGMVVHPGMQDPIGRSGSIGWGAGGDDLSTLMMARRNSSLGLSMMDRRGSLASLGQAVGLDPGDPTMPPHRPLVGGGAAAAYEAARHDHFTQKSQEQQRRASSLGLGSFGGGGLGGMGGMSVNPNQHYEMLKLHHMNLLNEIQETTLMMNLYQQQQLQQQQQQLQQQAGADQLGTSQSGDPGMFAGMGGQGMDMFSAQMRGSLGLGAGFGSMGMMQQQMMQGSSQTVPQQQGGQGDEGGLENRIAQLKQDIARNESGQSASGGGTSAEKKRKADDEEAADQSKRVKTEDDEANDDDDDDKDSSEND